MSAASITSRYSSDRICKCAHTRAGDCSMFDGESVRIRRRRRRGEGWDLEFNIHTEGEGAYIRYDMKKSGSGCSLDYDGTCSEIEIEKTQETNKYYYCI